MNKAMNKCSTLFLDALRASLLDTSVKWTDAQQISQQDWAQLFQLADTHQILPMIFEAVYNCPAASITVPAGPASPNGSAVPVGSAAPADLAAPPDPALMMSCRMNVQRSVIMQSIRTEEAIRLLSFLESKGLHPLVVKGIVCRNLYPRPDYRVSGDEDIWISWEEFEACHSAMLEFGMESADPALDIQAAHEVPYGKKGSPLYIELHKSLFPPESRAYGDLNRFFERAREHAIRVPASAGASAAAPDKEATASTNTGAAASGNNATCATNTSAAVPGNNATCATNISAAVPGNNATCAANISAAAAPGTIATLGYTDHLLYLICHAFKHFLHSGFGIRQVCDIALFANAYGREIDWGYVLDCCRQIRADQFAAALFRIGEKYLTFDPDRACLSDKWHQIQVDETPMLRDLLDAGVFGDGSMSRKHSSTITLEAVSAQKEGRRASHGLAKSLFPSVMELKGRYTYLENMPWLLPAAWVQRILRYRRELSHTGRSSGSNSGGNTAAEALEIGRQRVDLLRTYGILDK